MSPRHKLSCFCSSCLGHSASLTAHGHYKGAGLGASLGASLGAGLGLGADLGAGLLLKGKI